MAMLDETLNGRRDQSGLPDEMKTRYGHFPPRTMELLQFHCTRLLRKMSLKFADVPEMHAYRGAGVLNFGYERVPPRAMELLQVHRTRLCT